MAKIKAANHLRRLEKELEILVAQRTSELELELAERKRAEAEKASLEARLQQAQKLEAIGRLAGGVAHDFNNMLCVILMHTELAQARITPDHPLYTDLTEIRNAANRSADLTRQLLAFARKQLISPKILDLNETVGGMLKMLQRLIGEGIHIAWRPQADLWPIKIDPSQIDQILATLCINARDSIKDVGHLIIETSTALFAVDDCVDHPEFSPGEYALLTISDDGCGMDKETLKQIFEPFFTTRETNPGAGLGLATVYGIVKQNNGFIYVYSEPEIGTTFKIYLPRYGGPAVARQGSAVESLRGEGVTVLLVEDEPSLLGTIKNTLETQGYKVLAAASPAEAIRLSGEYDGVIQLLLTDVVLPGMNGLDMAGQIHSTRPTVKRLFISGFTANIIVHHCVIDEDMPFLQKPFSRYDLAKKVREVLGEGE